MPPLERTLECDSRTFSHAPGSVCVKRGAVPAASARTAWAAGQLPGGGAQWREEGVLPFTSPCLALGPHCLLELWNWGLTWWGRGYLRPRTLGGPTPRFKRAGGSRCSRQGGPKVGCQAGQLEPPLHPPLPLAVVPTSAGPPTAWPELASHSTPYGAGMVLRPHQAVLLPPR